jgi:glutamate dehydrogenase/leucine dehydrogenase
MRAVRIHKLTSTDAFIAFDLDDAPSANGVVRCARKVLTSSASELARASTYMFAAFGHKVGGASAGINAEGDDIAAAKTAFVEEIAEMVAAGTFLPDPALGVTPEDLAALTEADTRSALRFESVDGTSLPDHLVGVGAVAAAEALSGDLSGRTVAIDGFDAAGPTLATELAARGAKILAIATRSGAAVSEDGFDATALSEAWAAHGPNLMSELGVEAAMEWKVRATPVDVFFAGAKIGSIDHKNADKLPVKAIVPTGPLPFTTKAWVMLERRDVKLLPDFASTGGQVFAGFPPDGVDTVDGAANAVRSAVTDLVTEISQHERGAVMGGFAHAESFLRTWRDELPFGRPLAP